MSSRCCSDIVVPVGLWKVGIRYASAGFWLVRIWNVICSRSKPSGRWSMYRRFASPWKIVRSAGA